MAHLSLFPCSVSLLLVYLMSTSEPSLKPCPMLEMSFLSFKNMWGHFHDYSHRSSALRPSHVIEVANLHLTQLAWGKWREKAASGGRIAWETTSKNTLPGGGGGVRKEVEEWSVWEGCRQAEEGVGPVRASQTVWGKCNSDLQGDGGHSSASRRLCRCPLEGMTIRCEVLCTTFLTPGSL